jgi:hypothetical protein
MYGKDYGYRSGLNSSMAKHLQIKASNLINQFELNSSSRILDIGANDGTFLKNFTDLGSKLTAIDPTIPNWVEFYNFDAVLIDKLFDEKILSTTEIGTFDLISSISMFYDVPDPISFAALIKKLLSPSGIWHIELSYLPFMIRNNSYDTICHEHLEYYSLSSLFFILKSVQLQIINVNFNDINGGSIALDITHVSSKYFKSRININELIKQEESKIDSQSWDNFRISVDQSIGELKSKIQELSSDRARIVGIGASTKGNVILQASEMNQTLINFIAEINPRKYGKTTPGTKIPIKPECETRDPSIKTKLVLPWHFKNHIIKNEKDFLNSGGKLIFPLPKFEII